MIDMVGMNTGESVTEFRARLNLHLDRYRNVEGLVPFGEAWLNGPDGPIWTAKIGRIETRMIALNAPPQQTFIDMTEEEVAAAVAAGRVVAAPKGRVLGMKKES